MALTLTACGSSDKQASSDSSAGGSGHTYKIGISQIVEHPSLDLVVKGFKSEIAKAGLKVTYDDENAQNDQSNAAAIADQFANDKKMDLMLGIGTPAAQAIVNDEQTRPVLFAAVTDPVAAQLVPSLKASGTNVTGTSDANPESKPVALIKQILPNAKTIGVLYSSAEVNSEVQVKAFKQEAAGLGITIKEESITNSSEVGTGIEALKDTDAVLIPTDNTVVSAIDTVVSFCEDNDLPLFSADADSVAQGTIATRGLSYLQLGVATGDMAVKILKDGVKAGSIPTDVVETTQLKYNSVAAQKMGVTLPSSVTGTAGAIDVSKESASPSAS
ncbi:MAG: ABC transporter substrate-binding protein [Bifidobacteriaceae bacterium]|jgi:putative ABC transport system substrate-binding protein|nr:ABC transporter substrate-binding protein [Bifidobacteriaceae bacterium]